MRFLDYFQTSKLVLAPMRAVNCPSFRLMCKKYGAAMVYTQVFWAWEIGIWKDRLQQEFSGKDQPLVVQIGGNQPEELKAAVECLDPYADVIDFNAGCPNNYECGHKSGAFLLLHLNQMERAIRTVMGATQKPVTVKIRTGWSNDKINLPDTIKLLTDLGVAAITVHGRTREQLFKGRADWSQIAKAKYLTRIPIIGNGDVVSGQTAEQMLKTTNCDAIMIGRAAQGNPFIFSEIDTYLRSHQTTRQGFPERRNDFLEFCKMYHQYEKDRSVDEVRDHAMWFLKGLMYMNALKDKIRAAETIDKIENAFIRYKAPVPDGKPEI